MRSWLTTREVRAILGGVSQQRVSQLVKKGELVAEPDSDGKLKYDRVSAERYARDRAARAAMTAEDAEERKALNAESRDRFRRERARDRAAELARIERRDELLSRAVNALERIASCSRSR